MRETGRQKGKEGGRDSERGLPRSERVQSYPSSEFSHSETKQKLSSYVSDVTSVTVYMQGTLLVTHIHTSHTHARVHTHMTNTSKFTDMHTMAHNIIMNNIYFLRSKKRNVTYSHIHSKSANGLAFFARA